MTLMSLWLPLKGKRHTTFISASAPTMTNPEEIKDKFYEDLESLISTVPKENKLVVLDYFSARVGADYQTWQAVIGWNGVGKSNCNGHLLLKICAAHHLLNTNTVFLLPRGKKTSWMHLRSKHWHLIDYVMVKRRDRQDIRVTKAIEAQTAEQTTDSSSQNSTCTSSPSDARRGKRPIGDSMSASKNGTLCQNLSENLDSRLDQLSFGTNGAEEDWAAFRDVVYNTTLAHLDQNTRKQQDWLDDNDEDIRKLLDEKREAFRSLQQDTTSVSKKAAYNSIKSKVQGKLREMQDSWLSRKAHEIQKYSDSNNLKRFYNVLKTIYRPQSSGTSPTAQCRWVHPAH
ncbi:hypothetical protein NDU88_001403 [Pleurodeles waltl]|uniref:Uncharacterized protein n=1 Tax=Pleurodeles waltl TaxID=8319 RepID=A0AAV7MKW7_PLEWA|nr:hypothetical protein NDU88_001403 [Pleurodeles waltl]